MTQIDIPGHDMIGIRAGNPGPFTLTGTNSWLVGRGPSWLVDPGPALDSHLAGLFAAIVARGGLGGIALTHDHADHSGAVAAIRGRFPGVPLAAARGAVQARLGEGTRFGPLEAVLTPGHAPDHVAFLAGSACLSGDAVLGFGSVFIAPDAGALAGYLDGLARLARREIDVLCPGHGPPVTDPQTRLAEYIAHRLDRERRLVASLQEGARSVTELLDAAWGDVGPQLRAAAAATLAAHLDKLESEGRLPDGVERPAALALSEPESA